MSTRANERIETTAELVDLTNYMNTCMSDTFFKLKTGIRESMERLMFLMEYHIFAGNVLYCSDSWFQSRPFFDSDLGPIPGKPPFSRIFC
jgi:hypothetical protein